MLFYTPGLQANSKTINRYFEAMIFKREVSKKCMIHLRCMGKIHKLATENVLSSETFKLKVIPQKKSYWTVFF